MKVIEKIALLVFSASITLLGTLATCSNAAPLIVTQSETDGYITVSIDNLSDTNYDLEVSSDLENWKAFTIFPVEALPIDILLPVHENAQFLRLKSGTDEISQTITPTIDPKPRTNRMFGWDILNETPDSDFWENYQIVSEVGADFISIHFPWSSLEPDGSMGGISYIDPNGTLSALSVFIESVRETTGKSVKVALTLRPIDATGKTVPLDLQSESFGSETDTRMADRLTHVLVDHIFKSIPPESVTSLQIGNEIDEFDTSNEPADFWASYGWFLFHVKSKLAAFPETAEIPVGFTVTLPGIVNSTAEENAPFLALSSNVDVVGVTYYGNSESDWQLNDGSEDMILSELGSFADLFPDKPIYLQELGFQSSIANRSSEIRQALFFRNFFQAWDLLQTRVRLVNIVRLNDYSIETAETEAIPYHIQNGDVYYPNFVEYLRTLGLRTYSNSGRLKPAFDVIKIEANNRGWGVEN